MTPPLEVGGRADVPLRPITLPTLLRAVYRVLRVLSPPLAGRLARRLFFTPPPAQRRPEHSAQLATARRWEQAARRGRFVAWSFGSPSDPPVLLVHGWGGQAGQMLPFVAPLLARGLRPIVIDAPAHGDAPGSISSGLHFAAAIESLADPRRPFAGVVGHSFGCVGLTLALERGVAAQAAVYVAPPAGFESFFQRFGAALGLEARDHARLLKLAQRWLDLPLERFEPRRLAPGRTTPLLVVHDRGDDEVAFAEGEELARLWPGATLVPTAGLGHYRLLREGAVVERVVEFVAAPLQAVAAANSGR